MFELMLSCGDNIAHLF